jgi:hypothetical protein
MPEWWLEMQEALATEEMLAAYLDRCLLHHPLLTIILALSASGQRAISVRIVA